MRPLVPLVDVVIANEEDLQSVLGIEVRARRRHRRSCSMSARIRAAAGAWPSEFGVKRVAVTLRESMSASDNAWSAVLFDAATRDVPSEPALQRAAG